MLKAREVIKPADILASQLRQAGYKYHREFLFDPKPSQGESRKRRLWRFDFAFLEDRVAIEMDGGTWARKGAKKCRFCGQIPQGRHNTGKGIEGDCEKINHAQLLGWRVFRVTSGMVHDGRAMALVRNVLPRNSCADHGLRLHQEC